MWKWKRKWISQTCERETQGRGGVTWTFTIRNERAKTFKSAPLKIKDKKSQLTCPHFSFSAQLISTTFSLVWSSRLHVLPSLSFVHLPHRHYSFTFSKFTGTILYFKMYKEMMKLSFFEKVYLYHINMDSKKQKYNGTHYGLDNHI